MTNETKPVLLTEAEARAIYLAATSPDDFNNRLRERGLIVPAPDPSQAAVDAAGKLWEEVGPWSLGTIKKVTSHFANFEAEIRRGMELAKPELTREMVLDAARKSGCLDWMSGQDIDRLHAALTEQVRK